MSFLIILHSDVEFFTLLFLREMNEIIKRYYFYARDSKGFKLFWRLKNKNSLVLVIIILSTSAWGNSRYSGYFSLRNNQLSSDIGDVPGNRMLTNVNFNYVNKSYTDEEAKRALRLEAEVNDQDLLMFSVKEAYSTFGSNKTKLTLGRKILKWSPVDANWGFGKVNNRQNFNGFEPGQEGLTGIMLKQRWGSFSVEAFASYLYVPEMNPSLDINKSEQTITSRSAWAKAPNRTYDDGGNEIPIYYDVNYPEINEVVFRYSVGLSMNQDITKELSANIFWVKKPENTLSTTVDARLETPIPQRIVAEITPVVYYHDVAGGNLQYEFNKRFKIYASYLGIYPEEFPDGSQEDFDYTGIEEEKIQEQYAGGGLVYGDYKTQIGLHYVARVSRFILGDNPLATAPRWNQAVNFNISIRPFKKLQTSMDVKYDMLSFDRLAMLSANYHFSKKLFLGGGIQMIGAPRNAGTYWGAFRNNDSLYTNLKYIF